MHIEYTEGVIILPESILSIKSDIIQIRVLLWISSDTTLVAKPRQLAKLADCEMSEAVAALDFWRNAGVLVSEEQITAEENVSASDASAQDQQNALPAASEEQEPPKETKEKVYPEGHKAFPEAEPQDFPGKVESILGRELSNFEWDTINNLIDYLMISEEGLLLILSHCMRIGKKNMRNIERYAMSLADRGIKDVGSLQIELQRREDFLKFEQEIRELFGLGKRSVTEKERQIFSDWMDFGYDISIVSLAYDMTVQATGKASIPYANAILSRWNQENLQTRDDILNNIHQQKEAEKNKPFEPTFGNSFDTEDFFQAVLKRSFEKDSLLKKNSSQD